MAGMRVSLVAALLLFPGLAYADEREACVAAAESGQELRDDGKLLEARDKFIFCSREACPSVINKQCIEWLDETERKIPTVTFRATLDKKEIVDVRVYVDGELRAPSLDGRTIKLNPGRHKIRYTHAGVTDVQEDVLVSAGQQNRVIEATFVSGQSADTPKVVVVQPEPDSKPRSSDSAFRLPTSAIVSGAIGIVGIGSMALFAVLAKGDADDLRGTCSPRCADSDVDPARTKIVLANVSGLVGLVGLGAAAVLTILANTHSSAKRADLSRWTTF